MKHSLAFAKHIAMCNAAHVFMFHALLLLGLGVYFMPLTGYALSHADERLATACDHRHGAVATWSQTTDTDLLQEAIQTRGWYRDFIHWHTVPRFETTLYDFLAAHRGAIGGADVATLNYGEALEHKFLRDMATVSAAKEKNGIAIQVVYTDHYGGLPLRTIQIPLSVKVNLMGTALEGKEIACPEASGIRKLSDNQVAVEVPFHQRAESVTVHLREAVGKPGHLDFRLPSVVSVELTDNQLHVRTDRPTRLALFTLPAGLALANVCPAGTQPTATVELLGRGNTLAKCHVMDLDATAAELMTCDLYIGVISKERQSILWGPKCFRELNKTFMERIEKGITL